MNDKNVLKGQLLDYIRKESSVSKGKVQRKQHIVESVVNEKQLNFDFPADSNLAYVVGRRGHSFVLAKIQEVKKPKSENTKNLVTLAWGLYVTNVLFALFYVAPLIVSAFEGKNFVKAIVAFVFFIAQFYITMKAPSRIPDKKTFVSGIYESKELGIDPAHYELFEILDKNRKKYNFENLYELFCESYFDFNASGSKQAQETNLLIAKKIAKKVQTQIDIEIECGVTEKTFIDTKWDIVKENLDYID